MRWQVAGGEGTRRSDVTMQVSVVMLLCAVLTTAQEIPDGKSCYHRGLSRTGVCKPLDKCPRVYQEVKTKDPEYGCVPRFNPGSYLPNVCCPTEAEGGNGGNTSTQTPEKQAANPSSTSEETGSRKQNQNLKPSQLSCEEFLKSNETYIAPNSSGPGVIAMRMCRQYVGFVCSEDPSPLLLLDSSSPSDRCYLHTELISGGQVAEKNEFPHMALLGYGTANNITFACGGTLISPNFVLTAAHCVALRKARVRWVQLGVLRRGEEGAQLLRVTEVLQHPNYTASTYYHDLMLLRLHRPARLGEAVRPACLNTKPVSELVGFSAIVTGWGKLDYTEEEGSETLMKVTLPVKPLAACRQDENIPALPRGLQNTHLCAGGDSIKDSCNGDSGGPLQLTTVDDVYCMYRVIGVVSFGPPCGRGLPGIYTNVLPYLDWIEEVVWPFEFKSSS